MSSEHSVSHSDQDDSAKVTLTKAENTRIRVWKVCVISVIVATAAFVTTFAYRELNENQKKEYNESYIQYVDTIRAATKFSSGTLFTSFRVFSNTITAEASALGQTFPFVTLPSFEVLASGLRDTTGVEMILWHPKIQKEELEQWSNYTLENYQKMLDDARAAALALHAGGDLSIKPSDYKDGPISSLPYIPKFDAEGHWSEEEGLVFAPDYGDGPYWPGWFQSPPVFDPSFLNTDPAPWVLKDDIAAVEAARDIVMTDVIPAANLADRAAKREDHEAYHNKLVQSLGNETALSHPHSTVQVPVFEEMMNSNSKLVGTISVIVPWDRFLVGLLPEGVNGISCVLRSTCGRAFTYHLEGNKTFFVGEGDLHEHAMNHTEVEIPFRDNIQRRGHVEGECGYSFYIYSTKDLEENFYTNTPVLIAVAMGSTFFVIITTFLIYDGFVRDRNEKVVVVATRSSAIVTDLFPSTVRDRLMENGKAECSITPDTCDDEESGAAWRRAKPIADLYSDCTVLFADIAGFTAWSSGREPEQVFELLENLYHAFDVQAQRRRVFKVETIGDCYVAVTGVPQKQEDHAVRMVRFAFAIIAESRKVIEKLQPILGDDTLELEMRLGLHSGSVTGGVLRGQKSRFQLFGDTMNTASRMESNGLKGHVHASQETANKLIQHGKSDWLFAREDKIVAKGKGELQTYWIVPQNKATSTSGTSESDMSLGISEGD